MRAVLGIGSAHGDDRFGWWVIDQLQDELAGDVECIKISTPAAELIDELSRYSKVLLIDVAEFGAKPGVVRYIADGVASLVADDTVLSSHQIGVAEALSLVAALGLPLPDISLLVVQLQQAETMADISPLLINALPEVKQQVNNFMLQ